VIHVHKAVVAHHVTSKFVLDLHPQDVFWCTADPGRLAGTSYGMIAPLTCGITNIVAETEFDAELGRVARLVEIGRRGSEGMVGPIRRRGQGWRVSGRGWARHRPGAW
jgi:acyl-coenzyme A synthetase/AMP-(fatty) acid ligase